MNFREFGIVLVLLVGIALLVHPGLDGVVGQIRIFKKRVDCVQPETRYPALVPPARGIEHRLLDGRISPIQVGLRSIEEMVVVLICRWIKLPGRTAKNRDPVIRRLARALAIAPHVPVAMRSRLRGLGVQKPRVLVRAVVHHKVQNDANVVLLSFRNHVVEIGQRPVHRIDVLVIGHIVAEVHLGRGEARADPDGINPKVVQIVHLRSDAIQVADPVVVTIRETTRIDFVKHRMLPPLMAFRIDRFRLGKGSGRTAEGEQQRNHEQEPV